jgi:anaerobic selenocysteine-containing dehydrogenase
MERGMKLVVLDARSSYEASKGEWIPIRPCTEYAFLLGMAHTIMHEGLKFDVWFIKNRTNAPYLIGPDGDYYRDPETGKPMMWDSEAGFARTFDSDFEDIALEGAYAVNNVGCYTAFTLVKEEFKQYTPEWAAEKTDIKAETIRRISRELVDYARIGSTIEIDGFQFPFRPASVYTKSRPANSHRWGTLADLTGKIINMLIGNIEVPGGVQGDGIRGPALVPDEDGLCKPHMEAVPTPFKFPPDHIDGSEFYPNSHTGPHIMANAILDPQKYHLDYNAEAIIFAGGNPVKSTGECQTQVEAVKKVPFVVTCGIHIDETAILSDVVLPEHMAIERFVVKSPPRVAQPDRDNYGMHVAYLRQPVPHVFNSMHQDDIWMELAERIGILHGKGALYDCTNMANDYHRQYDGYCFKDEDKLELQDRKYTLYDLFERRLRGWKVGDNHSIDELSKNGFIVHRKSEKYAYPYFYHPDKETRHPFYFLHLKKTGDRLREDLENNNITFPGIKDMDYIFDVYCAIPRWFEHPDKDAPPEYDLWVINWRTPYFSTDTSNVSANPWLLEVSNNDPFEKDGIYLNVDTAKRKGFKQGDQVVIESLYGKTEGTLYLTERLHPESIGIPGCRGLTTVHSNPVLGKAPNWNALLPMDEKAFDPISLAMECSPKVKVYRKETC